MAAAERGCFALFLAYLIWLPLPFGSVIDAAWIPLVSVPLVLAAASLLLRARELPHAGIPRAMNVVLAGCGAILVLLAVQLLPLPATVLGALAPRSRQLWDGAAGIVSAAGDTTWARHALTVNPSQTTRECFRLAALGATFLSSAILVTSSRRRMVLAAVLGLSALFQILYGVRAAAVHRYAIWGWENTLIFNRVTGTFVNPNHFAHYIAIVLPLVLYAGAVAWHEANPNGQAPFHRQVASVVEHRAVQTGVAAIFFLAVMGGILVAQSRGALFAVAVGIVLATALSMRASNGKRKTRAWTAFSATLVLGLIVVALVGFLGRERTVARFNPLPGERATLVGRTVGIGAALGVFRRFPLFGSGAGTFEDVESMAQNQAPSVVFSHAHSDYAEMAATTGILGFGIAMTTLVLYLLSTLRTIEGDEASRSFRRRAFQIAVLSSVGIASTHALIDFNFFIPANAATLAAIVGASAAIHWPNHAGRGSSRGFERRAHAGG